MTEISLAPRRTHVNDDSAAAPGREAATGPITKAITLLALLADRAEGVGVRTLADQMGLPVSSTHRLLNVLASVDMVSQDATTRKYSVGLELYRIAALVSRNADLPRLSRPVLQQLAAESDESALLCLHLESQRTMMFVERIDGTQPLRYHIDLFKPMSLLWGASGRAILAYLDPEEVESIRANGGNAPAAGAHPPSRHELADRLGEVRRTGYAVSEGEKLPGARGVAAPLFGPGGVVGSLCITSPADRLEAGAAHVLGARLKDEALGLSAVLLGRDPVFDAEGFPT